MTKISSNIQLLNIIGKGAYGDVYMGINTKTKEHYAIKKITKKQLKSEIVYQYFNNEIFILKQVNHPNIIKLVDLKSGINCFFLIFEVCNGGCLSDILEKYKEKYNKPFSQEIVQYLMRQIISGFAYLHDMKILHRDVKLDNILITKYTY